MQKLDISSLKKAITSLDEAVTAYQKDPHILFVREAIIQRFEYTYELGHKTLKRYLEMSEPNAEEIDQMAFSSLIRTASERGLIQNGWDKWAVYRSARNLTSHTYNEEKALQVCAVIPEFLQDVKHLFLKIEERIATL